MHNFGFVDYDRTATSGTNAKMHEMSAAMALTSLEAMADIEAVNRANLARYAAGLDGLPGIRLLDFEPREASNCQYVIVRVDAATAGIHRDRVATLLRAEGVLARRYFAPGCHRMEPYVSEQPGLRMPVADQASEEVLALPTGTGTTLDEVDRVAQLIGLIVRNGAAIERRGAAIGAW